MYVLKYVNIVRVLINAQKKLHLTNRAQSGAVDYNSKTQNYLTILLSFELPEKNG